MKTIASGIDRLAEEFDRLPQESEGYTFLATIVDGDDRLLCDGKVDLHYMKKSPELPHGIFLPNKWPLQVNLENALVLKIADGREFDLLCLEKCLAGGTHYHFRLKPHARNFPIAGAAGVNYNQQLNNKQKDKLWH